MASIAPPSLPWQYPNPMSLSLNRQLLGNFTEPFGSRQHGARLAQQPFTGGREFDTCGWTLTNNVKPSSNSSSRIRCDSGGGRHVQASGGAPEVAFLGDRHEVAQPAQIHVCHATTVARRVRRLATS